MLHEKNNKKEKRQRLKRNFFVKKKNVNDLCNTQYAENTGLDYNVRKFG